MCRSLFSLPFSSGTCRTCGRGDIISAAEVAGGEDFWGVFQLLLIVWCFLPHPFQPAQISAPSGRMPLPSDSPERWAGDARGGPCPRWGRGGGGGHRTADARCLRAGPHPRPRRPHHRLPGGCAPSLVGPAKPPVWLEPAAFHLTVKLCEVFFSSRRPMWAEIGQN